MTLREVVNMLMNIAESQPAVNSVTEGSVYENLNANPSINYYNVNISQTNHRSDLEADYWQFNIFATDRLKDNDSNRLQVQSNAIEILRNIIKSFLDITGCDLYDEVVFTPFTERFVDVCAGAYAQVRFRIPVDYQCSELY